MRGRARRGPRDNLYRSESSAWDILLEFLPFIWPEGRSDLRRRVVYAVMALIAAKIVTVATPLAYKAAVDWLTDQSQTGPGDIPAGCPRPGAAWAAGQFISLRKLGLGHPAGISPLYLAGGPV